MNNSLIGKVNLLVALNHINIFVKIKKQIMERHTVYHFQTRQITVNTEFTDDNEMLDASFEDNSRREEIQTFTEFDQILTNKFMQVPLIESLEIDETKVETLSSHSQRAKQELDMPMSPLKKYRSYEQELNAEDGDLFNPTALNEGQSIVFSCTGHDQNIDISSIEEQACQLSWKRLSEEFDSLGPKKTNITILLANMDINAQLNSGNQIDIELELPLIASKDGDGYDLRALATKALETYHLDIDSGIQVDYWSNSLQMYILCNDLFALDSTDTHLILEEDLLFCELDEHDEREEAKTCLLLRFKNCTGNQIRLDCEQPRIGREEIAEAQISLSVDNMFKNQRTRTVKQVADMVLRWRTISSGYYDYTIQRYVAPITFDQAAANLASRHHQLTGEDQHIERKTLDDYYEKIKRGSDPNFLYNFE